MKSHITFAMAGVLLACLTDPAPVRPEPGRRNLIEPEPAPRPGR